jgi:hypothetical protein
MTRRLVTTGSAAFWCGLVGVLVGIVADVASLSRAPSFGTVAFYFLCAWILGLLYGALTGRVTPLIGALIVIAGIFTLYPLNVFWLAAEPFQSSKSIAADAVLLSLTGLSVLALKAWALRPAPAGRRYAVGGLGLVAAICMSLFSGSVTPAQDRKGKGPDILLIVLDSVRRDHVNFLGYARKTTDRFDPYLPEARVYENAYSTASWTVPSTLDILGAEEGKGAASGFPARLTPLGYATLMLSNNPHLSGPPAPYFGFEEKTRSVSDWRFKLWGSVAAEVLDRVRGGNDRGLADHLAEWIQGRTGPVYVHAHLMNAHTPFKFPPIDKQDRPGRRIEFPKTGQEMTAAESDSIVARYDEGVRTAFAAAWRMIETMRARRRPLLVLLTADHGEHLGEDGKWFHGVGLDQELLRIPLVALGEGVSPGRVSGLASNAQLAETILAAARGEVAPRDLRTSAGIDQVQGALPGDSAFRIRGSYKVVVSKNEPPRLYLLSDDGGVKDVTAAQPKLAKLLAAGLSLAPSTHAPPELDEATLEVLRSLGYVR